MNKTKLLTIAVIGLLLINLGTLCVLFFDKPPHQPPFGNMPPPHGEGPKQIIIDRLHFDAMQQKDYQLLIDYHHSKTEELHEASKKLHNDLYAFLKVDSTDKAKTDSLIAAIADNQTEIEHLNWDHFQDIKKLCKGEQVQLFNELADELAGLFGPKGGPLPPGK